MEGFKMTNACLLVIPVFGGSGSTPPGIDPDLWRTLLNEYLRCVSSNSRLQVQKLRVSGIIAAGAEDPNFWAARIRRSIFL